MELIVRDYDPRVRTGQEKKRDEDSPLPQRHTWKNAGESKTQTRAPGKGTRSILLLRRVGIREVGGRVQHLSSIEHERSITPKTRGRERKREKKPGGEER